DRRARHAHHRAAGSGDLPCQPLRPARVHRALRPRGPADGPADHRPPRRRGAGAGGCPPGRGAHRPAPAAPVARGRLMLKAVIFALDGTLIDSRQDLTDSIGALLAELGVGPLPSKLVESFIGEGASRLVSRSLAAARPGLEARTAELMPRW